MEGDKMKYRNFLYLFFISVVAFTMLFIYYQFSVFNIGVSLKYEEWATEELTITQASYLNKIYYLKRIILGVIIVFIISTIFRKKVFRKA